MIKAEGEDLRAIRVITLMLLAIFSLWLWAHLLSSPFGRDQGIFAWQGLTILRGGMPYLDAWDHKGPLAAMLYASVGASVLGVRVLDACLLGASLLAVVLLWPRRLVGVLSALFFFLLAAPDWWQSAQPDLWVAELLLLALALSQHPSRRAAVGVGFCLGITVWAKPVYALLVVVMGCSFLWRSLRHEDRADGRLLGFIVGAVVPSAVTLAWLAQGGALDAAIDAVVHFNLAVHLATGNLFGFMPPLRGVLYPGLALYDPLVFSAFVLFLCALWGIVRSRSWGVVTVWIAAWLCLALQEKFFKYHYFPHFAVMAVLAAEGAADVLERARRPLLVFVVLLCLLSPLALVATRLPPAFEAKPEGFSAASLQEIAAQIQSRSAEDDGLYVWGYDAGLYALAYRFPPTRYGYNYPLLVGDFAPRRAEVMGDLQRHPPRLVVVQHGDKNSLRDEDSATALQRFPQLQTFLNGYQEVWHNHEFVLFALKGGDGR